MTTIQDIADKMGVSKSTVSKALNDAPDISEALRKQVLELPWLWVIRSCGVIRNQQKKSVL